MEYVQALERELLPKAAAFRPDFVLISAGFDAHFSDPLGEMKVSEEGFGNLTRLVRQIADRHCGGRIVSALEGGYDLDALAGSVERHVRELKG